MTTRELIAKLQALDPGGDKEVEYLDAEWGWTEITQVRFADRNEQVVGLEV